MQNDGGLLAPPHRKCTNVRISVCYSGCSAADKSALQRVINTAQKITGCSLPGKHCPLPLPQKGQKHHERHITPRPPPVYSPALWQMVQVLQSKDHASKGQFSPNDHQNIKLKHALKFDHTTPHHTRPFQTRPDRIGSDHTRLHQTRSDPWPASRGITVHHEGQQRTVKENRGLRRTPETRTGQTGSGPWPAS